MTEGLEVIECNLSEVQLTEDNGAQIMVLGEILGERQFPIFIGMHEMDALDRALHGKAAPRPLTHDLANNLVEGMGGEMVRVIIDDLREDTFFAKVIVRSADGTEARVDARPSDAMVLAARCKLPVFVAAHVLDNIGRPRPTEDFE